MPPTSFSQPSGSGPGCGCQHEHPPYLEREQSLQAKAEFRTLHICGNRLRMLLSCQHSPLLCSPHHPRPENLGDNQSIFGGTLCVLAGADRLCLRPAQEGELQEQRRGDADGEGTYLPPGPSTPRLPGPAVVPAAPPGLGAQAPGPQMGLLGPSSLTCGWEARLMATTAPHAASPLVSLPATLWVLSQPWTHVGSKSCLLCQSPCHLFSKK